MGNFNKCLNYFWRLYGPKIEYELKLHGKCCFKKKKSESFKIIIVYINYQGTMIFISSNVYNMYVIKSELNLLGKWLYLSLIH